MTLVMDLPASKSLRLAPYINNMYNVHCTLIVKIDCAVLIQQWHKSVLNTDYDYDRIRLFCGKFDVTKFNYGMLYN